MKRKTRTLFISIALSFLLGFITGTDLFASQAEERLFGTLAETIFVNDSTPEWEEMAMFEAENSPLNHAVRAIRHNFQIKRISSSSNSRYGLTFVKRNHISYSSPLIFESFKRFPSGLTEARRHLISLGKLII